MVKIQSNNAHYIRPKNLFISVFSHSVQSIFRASIPIQIVSKRFTKPGLEPLDSPSSGRNLNLNLIGYCGVSQMAIVSSMRHVISIQSEMLWLCCCLVMTRFSPIEGFKWVEKDAYETGQTHGSGCSLHSHLCDCQTIVWWICGIKPGTLSLQRWMKIHLSFCLLCQFHQVSYL